MPSDKEVFGGVATWEPCRLVQKDARCFNLFTSDVYMFLGNHALSTALPLDSNQHARTEQVFKENFLINVGHVLRGVCQAMQKVTDLTNHGAGHTLLKSRLVSLGLDPEARGMLQPAHHLSVVHSDSHQDVAPKVPCARCHGEMQGCH